MKRLKQSQVANYKKKLLRQQDEKCGLCGMDMTYVETRNICLDHDHKHGHVRAALCRNCNGIEGKIYNLANRGKRSSTVQQFLQKVLNFWEDHDISNYIEPVYHPSHKTLEEQRLLRNKKARLARVRRKAAKTVKGSK